MSLPHKLLPVTYQARLFFSTNAAACGMYVRGRELAWNCVCGGTDWQQMLLPVACISRFHMCVITHPCVTHMSHVFPTHLCRSNYDFREALKSAQLHVEYRLENIMNSGMHLQMFIYMWCIFLYLFNVVFYTYICACVCMSVRDDVYTCVNMYICICIRICICIYRNTCMCA